MWVKGVIRNHQKNPLKLCKTFVQRWDFFELILLYFSKDISTANDNWRDGKVGDAVVVGLRTPFQLFGMIFGLGFTPTGVQRPVRLVYELLSKSEWLHDTIPPVCLVRHNSSLKKNILIHLLHFKGITSSFFCTKLEESTDFYLKGYHLNVIFVKQIMTNFRLLIKHHMSQPITFDAESSIRCSVMIKWGFDLKWNNNETLSEEDWCALACGCSWMLALWLPGCFQRSARQMRAGLMLGFVP